MQLLSLYRKYVISILFVKTAILLFDKIQQYISKTFSYLYLYLKKPYNYLFLKNVSEKPPFFEQGLIWDMLRQKMF